MLSFMHCEWCMNSFLTQWLETRVLWRTLGILTSILASEVLNQSSVKLSILPITIISRLSLDDFNFLLKCCEKNKFHNNIYLNDFMCIVLGYTLNKYCLELPLHTQLIPLDFGRDNSLEVFYAGRWEGGGGKFCSLFCFALSLLQVFSSPSANQHKWVHN